MGIVTFTLKPVDELPHQRLAVIEYFLSQSPEGTVVHHAEKVASERIYGIRHDVWDVNAGDGRWWVITNPMNLYPQETVSTPSMDHALALHIGVLARVFARQYYDPPVVGATRDYVARAWRKYEQAGEALNEADEAEDFQAVGARLRESLISFVHERAGEAILREGVDPPKRSDFKGWTELLAETASPGPGGAGIRRYLRTIARETWDLVSWLAHAANATRAEAETAFKATENVLATFSLSLLRATEGEPVRCNSCGSYKVVAEHVRDEEGFPLDETYLLCEACGWTSDVLVAEASSETT